MRNALVPGLGGPMGHHARPRGVWFDPLPWAIAVGTVSFLVLFLRHTLCVQTGVGQEIDSYARLCYSDIQTVLRGQGLPTGGSPFGGESLSVPPLVGVLLLAATAVARVLGVPVGPFASDQEQLDASVVAFGVVAVVLYVSLVVWIVAAARWGRRAGRRASWDAMLVASSPIVAASGLVSWDLLPVALTAMALVFLARGRDLEAGVMLGVAASAGTMPIGVALAVTVAAGLRGGSVSAGRVALPALASWLLVHAPLLATQPRSIFNFYHGEVHKERGYGSWWYLLELMGYPVRHAGSLAFVMTTLALLGVIAFLYVARRRPRPGQLIAVVILTATVLGPSFPPQTSLWVLLAVLLARPFRGELIAVTVAHVGYYLAIWGWLAGTLTLAQYGPYGLYWAAIVARTAVDAWLLALVLRDAAATPRSPAPPPARHAVEPGQRPA